MLITHLTKTLEELIRLSKSNDFILEVDTKDSGGSDDDDIITFIK